MKRCVRRAILETKTTQMIPEQISYLLFKEITYPISDPQKSEFFIKNCILPRKCQADLERKGGKKKIMLPS